MYCAAGETGRVHLLVGSAAPVNVCRCGVFAKCVCVCTHSQCGSVVISTFPPAQPCRSILRTAFVLAGGAGRRPGSAEETFKGAAGFL